MPMGVTSESIREMSIDGLRELNDIAGKMVTLTTMPQLSSEYAELEALTKAEILRREAEASVILQGAAREFLEREENRAEDNARILRAKQSLADKGIKIDVFPNLISEARIYHLATLMEAADAIADQNEYLTTKAPRSVGKSRLPSRQLQEEYGAATGEVDKAIKNIEKLVNDKIEEGKQADRLARTVAIPAKFKVNGALKDYGRYIYPAAGAIQYNNAKTYVLSPSRTLVHVKDELPQNATPALAGQYLAAVVAACISFIDQKAFSEDKVKINGVLPSGKTFFWWVIGKTKASQPGYAGEIFHIDSGYAKSKWKSE